MESENKKIPVQVKRIITIALLLALIVLVLTVFNYRNARKLMYNYLENEAINLALSYQGATRNSAMNSQDIEQNLQTLLEPYKQKKQVAFLSIIDREGSTLAHFEKTPLGKASGLGNFRQVLKEERITAKEILLPSGEKVYDVFLPLHLGWLERQERENYPVDGSHPGFKVMRVGIYSNYGYPFVHGALIQMILVGLLTVVFGVLSLFQIRTLKDYFALQERNKKQEKLAAIGTMTAGVAHEIRNPLGAAKGFAQLLAEGKADEDEKTLYLEAIVKETQRLEGFLNLLLDYTRVRTLHRVDIIIPHLIQEVITLVREEAEKCRIVIKAAFKPEEFIFNGDPNLLKQVFLNLALNAIQAMPDGGALEITAQETLRNILIIFKDQGPGLEIGKEEQVFQPFFTTKEKGSGLGLAISQQIITEHGGVITAVTGTGYGEFRVVLPIGGNQ